MKKKEYNKPACLVVALPHMAILNGTGTPNPPVGPGTNTEEACARSQRLRIFDEDEEDW
jgi:hypothetical protein